VSAFGQRQAALLGTVGSPSAPPKLSKADEAALSALRCERCLALAGAGLPVPRAVERLLAHRVRYVRNVGLDRALGTPGETRPRESASSTSAASSSVAKPVQSDSRRCGGCASHYCGDPQGQSQAAHV